MDSLIKREAQSESLSEMDVTAWVEQQLAVVPGPQDGYSDAQFMADLTNASDPLEQRATRARKAAEQGTAKMFPR